MDIKLNEQAETNGLARRPKAPYHVVKTKQGVKLVDATGKGINPGAGPAVGRPRK